MARESDEKRKREREAYFGRGKEDR